MAEKKKRGGRTSSPRHGKNFEYTPEIGVKICSMIAQGASIRTVCKDPDMPGSETFFRWIRNHQDFHNMYIIATQERAEHLVEEALEIADDGTNDYVEQHGDDTAKAAYKTNGEAIQRSRLRVDTRKWMAAKMKPEKYGERVQQEISGPGGKPIESEVNVIFSPVSNDKKK